MEQSVGNFNVLRTVGLGATAEVRLARTLNEHPVAIKALKKSLNFSQNPSYSFERERQILESLEHPSIPKLLGSFKDESSEFLVLEFIPGGELFSRMREKSQFSSFETKFYTACIAETLTYLHEKLIIYRDLKPENLIINEEGYITIVDFGLAKQGVEKTYTMCGTPHYLAPEIVLGRAHGKEVDWWALGVLIYEMIVGKPPFDDENPNNIYEKILTKRYEIPEWVDEGSNYVIRRFLELRASKRLGKEIVEDEWLDGFSIETIYNRGMKAPWVPEIDPSDLAEYFEYFSDDNCPVIPLTRCSMEIFEDF